MRKQTVHLKKGFTLTELMAVVVIIGILSALALGSYTKSLERARFSEAITNAHALAAAVDTYYYDHNFTVPPVSKFFKEKAAISLSHTDNVTDEAIQTEKFLYTYDGIKISVSRRNPGGLVYVINVYPETTGGKDKQDECDFGSNVDAKTFCQSVGFTKCSGTVCKKI